MLALIVSLMMSATNPTVLSVPIPDAKSVWIEKLIECESGNNPTIKVLDTDGFYSYGAAQFHLKTWLDFGKDFRTTKENIYDGDLQRKVVRDMLDKGFKNQWYWCSKSVERSLGNYQ